MKYYKLRIDTSDLEMCIHIAEHYSPDCWAFSFETKWGDNPHVHFYLEMADGVSGLRSYIRKTVGSGNRAYSLKELAEEKPVEYLAYLIKENDYRSYKIDLTAAKAYDATVKSAIQEKKSSRKTILQQIVEQFGYTGSTILEEKQCIEDVIDFYKQKFTLVREFQIVSLVQTLLLQYGDGYERRLRYSVSRSLDRHPY